MEGGDFCMSSIDERVVQMKFNNSQFESGVKQTQSSLDALKKGLNLDASAKSLEGLHAAGSKFDLSRIADGVQGLGSKFSALGIMGITALTNIANKAVNVGAQLLSSLTIDPIKAGFDEYELKMGSIQTILANTSKDGTTLKQVTASLDELNKYADKTIYNFGDMTKNIGLFTNAGIGIKDATSMIKGFSNEAAASGTSASGAAGAAYQLSQALSSGKITLETWRSLTNVGMGNKNMQNGLIDIASAMGTFTGKGTDATAAAKDFNASLEKGWVTADVMQNYLKIQAGELSAAQMKTLGLSDEQITSFQKQQKIAEESATKVRTWSQLVGTMQESVGSGWSETFDTLIGDFDQATKLWSGVNKALGPMISAAGDARNALLKSWAKLGGRDVAISAISNAFKILMSLMKPIGDAFKTIFPPTTGKQLFDLTVGFQKFVKSLTPSTQTLVNIKRIAVGLFSAIDIGIMVIKGFVGMLGNLFKSTSKGSGNILDFAAKIGDWLFKVRLAIKKGDDLTKFFSGLTTTIQKVIDFFKRAAGAVGDFFGKFNIDKAAKGLSDAGSQIQAKLSPLKSLGENLHTIWSGLGDVFNNVKNFFAPVGQFFADIGKKIGDAMSGPMDFGVILDFVQAGLLTGLFMTLKKFIGGGLVDQIKEALGGLLSGGGGPSMVDTIKEAIGGLTETLTAMQQSLKAGTLLMIAGAIALLTASIVALTKVDQAKLASSLAAMTVMFTQLLTAMAILDKINMKTGVFKLMAIGTAMILMAVAIKILASAVKDMSGMDWNGLAKGLVGVTVLLGGLAGATKLMSNQNGSMIRTGIGLIAVAVAVKILASAVKDFSSLSWDDMAKGLTGVGSVLAALTLFTRLAKFNKGAVGSSVGLILLGVALKVIATAVKDFAAFDVASLQQGLGAIILVLGALATFTRLVDPTKIVSVSVGMVILGGALKIMASAMKDFSGMSWEELQRGIAGLGGSLLVIAAAMNMMPANMLVSAASLVIVAAALKILAEVLTSMGGMSWDEIGKGLVTLAGSLVIIAGAMFLMSTALPGAAALLIVSAALTMLLPVLQALGSMSLLEIGTALAALAAVFILLGAAGLILTPVIPALMGLGIAIALIGVGALAVGIGLLAFATGLGMLAAMGAVATPVLVNMVTSLLNLIPLAMTKLGQGILALANVIANGGPVLVRALVTVLMSLISAINIVAPAIIQTLVRLVMMLVNVLVTNVPKLVDAGMKMLVGILNGIGRNIGDVVTAAVKIITEFIGGIANNLGKIAQSGADLIIKFVESMASTVRNNSTRMGEAGGDLAVAIIDGMVNGVSAGIGRVAAAAGDVAKSALDTVKSWLGIKSPSREFFKIGAWSTQGMANGLTKTVGTVASAAKYVGTTALSSLKDSLSNMGSAVASNMDMSPTIKPVLDLTAIKKDSGLIGDLIGTPSLSVQGSYAKASTLAANARASQESVVIGKGDTSVATRDGITLVQNNYSPKALSSADIYRKTKNQLSLAKGALATSNA
jgi:tape measure domain-containing protein